jgi:hypothetical protein
VGLRYREFSMTCPVMASKQRIQDDRKRFRNGLSDLLEELRSSSNMRSTNGPQEETQSGAVALHMSNPDADAERLHFYFVYHGYNELDNQRAVHRLFRTASPGLKYVAPHLRGTNQHKHELCQEGESSGRQESPERTRPLVGFISRVWFDHHPHGMYA